MWAETVIEFRHGFSRLRASHCQGGYCVRCKIGLSTKSRGVIVPPQTVFGWLLQVFGVGGRGSTRMSA
jgi:hypothetical protein